MMLIKTSDFDKEIHCVLFKDKKRYRLCHICMENLADIDKNDFVACDICVSKAKDSKDAIAYMKAFKREWFKMWKKLCKESGDSEY